MTTRTPLPVRRSPAALAGTDPALVRQAVLDAFIKLNPRHMLRNPVMFTVEVTTALSLVFWIVNL